MRIKRILWKSNNFMVTSFPVKMMSDQNEICCNSRFRVEFLNEKNRLGFPISGKALEFLDWGHLFNFEIEKNRTKRSRIGHQTFLLSIGLSVNFILVFCFSLLRLWILFATMSGVSLLYDGLDVIVTALMNGNKRAIKVTIFIYLSRLGCDLHRRIHRF